MPFEFKNQNMGDMLDLCESWWVDLKGGPHINVDEVPMKRFLVFALKKRIIIDEKELETLFKDSSANEKLAENSFLKKSEFLRIFSRSCLKGALQNVYDFLDKSSIIMKC
jgi:hypothetical protein